MASIMVVDNDPSVANMIKRMLEGAGHTVTTATGGFECLEKLKKTKPDLLLLDVMMPDLSGWDLYWRIRKDDEKIKVAFVSVMEVSPERKKELINEYGISDYILKPFTQDQLTQAVDNILKNQHKPHQKPPI